MQISLFLVPLLVYLIGGHHLERNSVDLSYTKVDLMKKLNANIKKKNVVIGTRINCFFKHLKKGKALSTSMEEEKKDNKANINSKKLKRSEGTTIN